MILKRTHWLFIGTYKILNGSKILKINSKSNFSLGSLKLIEAQMILEIETDCLLELNTGKLYL